MACEAAGTLVPLFAPQCRSSNGAPRSQTLVARRISGHLTDAIFQRYDITSDQDLSEAAEKIGTKLGQKSNVEIEIVSK